MLSAILLLPGCQQEQTQLTGGPAQIQRQQIYDQLVLLESSLAADYPTDGLGVPQSSPREWVRGHPLISSAAFENARVTRLKAFQEIADLAAPEEDAYDFDAFWEIHSAYRMAVDIARQGQGRIDLVYSRPYPIDHVDGPHLQALETLNSLTLSDSTPTALLAAQPDIAAALKSGRHRLNFDRAAGLMVPPIILSRILSAIDASPYRSEDAYLAWMRNWRRPANAAAPRPDELLAVADQNRQLVLPEMLAYREEVAAMLAAQSQGSPSASMHFEFYESLIRQMTSGRGNSAECFNSAGRLADETLSDFWELVVANWNAHIPPPEGTEVVAPLAVDTPKNPYDVLAEWAHRAPLYPPEPETVQVTEPASAPSQTADTALALPDIFVQFEKDYRRLSREIVGLSEHKLPATRLVPVIPAELPAGASQTRPRPQPNRPLFTSDFSVGDQEIDIRATSLGTR